MGGRTGRLAGAVTGRRPRRPAGVAGLSLIERDVLELASRGKSYKEIAAARSVSVDTIRAELQLIRVRLGAASTTEAVAIYVEWKARCSL